MSKDNNLTDAAKNARREYIKKWRQNNPDKVKQYNNAYWEKKAQALANGTRA